MDATPAGFEEIEHTADWALRVWASDLPGLFRQAAEGMYALSEAALADGEQEKREITLKAEDAESLLVAFLSELLFLGEAENLGFEEFFIQIADSRKGEMQLEARVEGAVFKSRKKEIKAVTYHNLEIRKSERGFEAEIVFDV